VTALREEYPHTSVETLCSLFGKRRQWYYKKSIFVVSYNHIRPHMSIGMMAPMEVYLGGEPGKNLWKKKKVDDNQEKLSIFALPNNQGWLCIVHCHPS
jgi:hypothetical protein